MARFLVSLFRCSLLLTVASAWPGCSRQDGSERMFEVRGVVRGQFDATDRSIRIEHEAIPGYMPAMTMPFYTTQDEVAGLAPGDRVIFEFRVGEHSRAEKFRKLGRVAESAPSPTPAPRTQRLKEGDLVPAFSLLNQDGRAVGDASLQGHYTVLTFLFTRCPVPEFCPLLAKKFKTLQESLREATAGDVQLVSVTIDPDYDRPDILRAYGESLGADFRRWQFLTGDSGEIQKMARLFAVRTERNGPTLDHTLATALIGPRGEVIDVWRGNAWRPDEVLSRIGNVVKP